MKLSIKSLLLFIIIAVVTFSLSFLSERQCQAKVFQWIDQNKVLHIQNKAPLWWKPDKLVFEYKRVVNKPATCKKLKLPIDTPDFDKKNSDNEPFSVEKKGNSLIISTTEGKSNKNNKKDLGKIPRSENELKRLPKGSVIGDAKTKLFHTPDCNRICYKYKRYHRYKIPINQMRIFYSKNQAIQSGYFPCPVCGGKPN